MTTRTLVAAALMATLAHGVALAADASPGAGDATAGTSGKPTRESKDLADYLVDIGAGPVSAAELIGVSATAVTNVQSLKDFNVLFSPGVGGEQKTGMGLQITPARTQWSPLTVGKYSTDDFSRLLGSLSLSYAKNSAIYGSTTFQQEAAALHVAYYLHAQNDPVVAAHFAFKDCEAKRKIDDATLKEISDKAAADWKNKIQSDHLPENALPTQEFLDAVSNAYMVSPEYIKHSSDADKAVMQCVADKAVDAWNKPLVSLTLGAARIRPDAGGKQLTLARSLSVSAVLPDRDVGVFNLVARLNRHEVDTTTLATTPTYSSRTLVAARYTYRGPKDSDLYKLVEVSNARNSDGTVSSAAFKLALGVDKKISEGVWLEFRVGRARSNDGTGDQTKALMSFKWSPTPTLPTLFAKP